jgi:hypothetical protein
MVAPSFSASKSSARRRCQIEIVQDCHDCADCVGMGADKLQATSNVAHQGRFRGLDEGEQFRAAHARAGQGEPLTLGHPEFEGFESVLALLPKGRAA